MIKLAIHLNQKYFELEESYRFFIAIALAYPGIFFNPIYLIVLIPMFYIKNVEKYF